MTYGGLESAPAIRERTREKAELLSCYRIGTRPEMRECDENLQKWQAGRNNSEFYAESHLGRNHLLLPYRVLENMGE